MDGFLTSFDSLIQGGFRCPYWLVLFFWVSQASCLTSICWFPC